MQGFATFRRLLVLLVPTLLLGSTTLVASAAINSSPVVQLVSYSDQYGLQVNMLGWGSASIINNQGVILSNNHVVDDGSGSLATAFSVCVTKKALERPVCDYTASLIDRNSDMDIAILKIDPKDVHGNPVDYGQFATLPMDFAYRPTVQDDVLIVGYPWIGADTITETKGIVSGTTEYNGYQYIKTDAIIAGGNSGGAMISPAGKLIGIPTFTIGGNFDSNLGYGLSLAEAQEFIEANVNKAPIITTQHVDFSGYQRLLDSINAKGVVEDDLLSYTFPSDYKVSNYIKNRTLRLESKAQKQIAVDEITIVLEETPVLETEKDYLYYLEAMGYYSPEEEVIQKKSIGGLTMLTTVSRGDVSKGENNPFQGYFAQISPRLTLQIALIAPLYDEKNHSRLQEEIARVLTGLQIRPKVEILEDSFTFSLKKPPLDIATNENSMADAYYGRFTQFLGNMYTYVHLATGPQGMFMGKGQSLEDIMKSETEGLDKNLIQKVTLQGSEGYIACQATPESPLPISYIPEPFYGLYKDKDGSILPPRRMCLVRLITGISDDAGAPYNINITIAGPSSTMSATVDQALAFLASRVNLSLEGDTSLKNPYVTALRLNFRDLTDQSEDYKQSLLRMVRYGILKNGLAFNPYMPLRWKDFLSLYVRSVYNVQPDSTDCVRGDNTCFLTKAQIPGTRGTKVVGDFVRTFGIDLEGYMPASAGYSLDLLFRSFLVDMTIGNNSENDLQLYRSNPQLPRFEEVNRALSELDYLLYGPRKIDMNALGEWTYYMASSFTSNREVIFSPVRGLISRTWSSTEPANFSPNSPFVLGTYALTTFAENQARYGKAYETMLTCSKNLSLINTCVREYTLTVAKYMEEDQQEMLSFPVMTRAQAYDTVMPLMDFALFDPELAKLKSVEAEETPPSLE